MVITDRFVYIHLPKTGGTFVTAVLKKLYQNLEIKYPDQGFYFQDLMVPGTGLRSKIKGIKTAHGGVLQIPHQHRNKVIISSIRNPYDHYVSFYEFRYWERGFPIKAEIIKKQFPNYPQLSFPEYLRFATDIHVKKKKAILMSRLNIGFLTRHYINFYFKEPQKVMPQFTDEYISRKAYKTDMEDIIYLRTEQLNQDLYRVLLQLGYKHDDIAFIIEEGKILPSFSTRNEKNNWEKYYTPALFDFVREKERFIFQLFPDYDLQFTHSDQIP